MGLAIVGLEVGAHIVDVAGDLRLERIEGLELRLVAQLVHEIDIDMPAVDVAIEIQQVDFQHRLHACVHGRAHADVGGARQRLRVDARNGDGKYAGQRQALAPDLDVGRRKADGAAELPAVHDAAGDDEGAPQQFLGVFDVARGKRLAHRGTGNPDAAEIHGAHRLDDETVFLPGALEKIVDEVIAANAKNVAEFKAGNDKALNALVGQIMKGSKGKANPQQVNDLLRSKLA